jgi:hypothetical protein
VRTAIALSLACCALACCALAACGAEEALNPLPVDAGATDAGTDAGSGGSAPDAGAPKRTVLQRNPFGNVAETENLMLDGDFEWFTPFADQYAWLSGSSLSAIGYTLPDVALGAACRSGLRCASVKKHAVILGLGLASQGTKLEVSVWAKVTAGPCSKVIVTLADWDGLQDPSLPSDLNVAVKPVADQPDADGWCHLGAVVDARAHKPALIISNSTAGVMLVDDVVLRKAPVTKALFVEHGPPSAEAAADLRTAGEALRRLRGPHDAPPNEARRAYDKSRHDGAASGPKPRTPSER